MQLKTFLTFVILDEYLVINVILKIDTGVFIIMPHLYIWGEIQKTGMTYIRF